MDLPNLTTSKSKDGASNGLNYLRESTNPTKHVETQTKCNSNGDSSSLEISKNGSRFHFSIYKWANMGGVPVAIPLRGSDRLKGKDKLQRCSSANGWITSESKAKEPRDKLHNCKSFRGEHGKSENVGSLIDSRNEDVGPGQVIEEGNITKSESEIINKHKSTDKNVSKRKVSAVEKATHKPQPKPLNLIFNNDYDDEQGNDEITRNCGRKDISKMSAKKQDVKKRVTSNNVEASTTRIKHSPRNSWDDTKARVRGKIKEFIKIFNQDASLKPRPDTALPENHGSSRKERGTVQPEIEPSISMNKRIEKIHLNNVLKKKSYSDIPAVNHMCKGASDKNINRSVNDTVSYGSKTIVEDPAESFDNYILVEELRPEEKILSQFGIDPEEIMAIDDKIQQWSNGKQGNIRSLLSTLQYVLWPDSSWKPVPLVDIIEGPSVKRSYQKALLCLHPDKLQQKGAASDKKYFAQRVFDILQDAWTHFNSLGPV
ncbi:J domain-containing protein required for chloroplast accumulation response 1 isoform X1 [Gossypium hirsutum]|uniref:J domain-containing protein required for chloroplast accumulation response 1 isoform X1 n=1 Tax=Gossypium hirsutum TaxID=3635 RepID=A0ABM3BRW1_GOSHI|nr:J domain-containing protein required for chloroplast accumulation response 1 isoform X1 [Gossypium hirsutum]XP_040969785.1 J domain-containing protein required for chloroplast accumulation response 1 isoform X1 [Gossypium hirsutum]